MLSFPRSARWPAVAAATAALVMLSACGKKDEPAAPAAQGSVPATASAEPLKVGFVYIGPVSDAGYTQAHDNARKAIEAEFGDKVKTTYVENVPETADAERVLRDLARQGNKVIFANSFGYMDFVQQVANDFPDVRFEHATGYKQSANFRTFDARTYEGAYLAGVIAGKQTQTNKLGVVGSVPIPEVLRNINSFALGARSVNPQATVRVVWVNKWFDPGQEREGAMALLDQGADVLMQNTNSTAVVQAAEERGKMALGWNSDMSKFGPKAHLGSVALNFGPYYTSSVRQVIDGSWQGNQHSWLGVKEGAIDLVAAREDLPADLKTMLDERRAGLKDGTYAIWKGPIRDQSGKEVLADGQVADDAWLRQISWYVEGVESTLPNAK